MNKYKNNKKGFTIVELVIVIAVIAILSAVLIPTISGLIKKANVTADQTLVRNLNTSLAIASDGKDGKSTMYETLKDIEDQGYVVSRLTPTSAGSDIVWDSEKNQFVLVMENGKYYTGTTYEDYSEDDYYKLWKIYDNTNVSDSKYSVYLSSEKGEVTGEVTVNGVGFDAGDNTGITKVTYNGNDVSRDVVIRTNGGELVVNDTNSNNQQKHYGYADKVEVTTGTSCYHEYGNVDILVAKVGNVIAESGSKVSVAVSQTSATIETKENATIETKQENVSEENTNKLLNATAVVGVTAYDSLETAITGASAGDTVKLLKDISSSTTINIDKELILDGNGHKLTTSVETTSIMVVSGTGDFTLKNLTVYASKEIKEAKYGGTNADILLKTTGKVVIEGCTFDGISKAYYNVIEFGQDTVVKDGTSFINNTFVGTSMRHNAINIFTEEENSTIYLTGNSFIDLLTSDTNAIRISDYTDAAVTFEIKDNIYSYVAASNDTIYDGFALIQQNKGGIANISLHFKNLLVNGKVATSNNQETHNQVYYIFSNKVFYDGLKEVTF